MKAPKGFGKNYFSLSAILAYSIEPVLHSTFTRLKSTNSLSISKEDDDLEEDPPPDLELCLQNIVSFNKPCHCDCVFRSKTSIIVSLFNFIPRCPYYRTHFAFRRTGVHPPSLLF